MFAKIAKRSETPKWQLSIDSLTEAVSPLPAQSQSYDESIEVRDVIAVATMHLVERAAGKMLTAKQAQISKISNLCGNMIPRLKANSHFQSAWYPSTIKPDGKDLLSTLVPSDGKQASYRGAVMGMKTKQGILSI